MTNDDRNWELRWSHERRRINLSRAIAVDMESGTVAAQGYRLRVPYGTLLCVSDKPLHGEIKLPGAANAFLRSRRRRTPDDRARRDRAAEKRSDAAPFAQIEKFRRAALPLNFAEIRSSSVQIHENTGDLLQTGRATVSPVGILVIGVPMLRSSFAALIFAALAAFPAISPAFAQEHGNTHRGRSRLSVTAKRRFAPDLAMITLGRHEFGTTAREALDANNAAMNSVMTGLKSAGIAPNDMQTSNFTISPRYDFGQDNRQPPRVVAYDVSNTVTITVRKLDTLGAVLDQTVSQGSNQINGIMFSASRSGACPG